MQPGLAFYIFLFFFFGGGGGGGVLVGGVGLGGRWEVGGMIVAEYILSAKYKHCVHSLFFDRCAV